jgi:polyketide synthase PksN
LAGVVKVVLAMRHGIIPANLHFQSCNPKIQLEGSPFFVVDRNLPWSRLKDDRGNEIPRRAGVSSYGFSGENVHVVIEEFIRPPGEPITPDHHVAGAELILLSARTKERLRILAEHLADHLDGAIAAGSKVALRDLAYTLQLGREAMTERTAFVAETLEEVCGELRRLAHGSEGVALMQGTLQDKGVAGALTEGPSRELFVDALIKERDCRRLGQLWVAGANVDWRKLYRGDRPHRLSLPAYPFDRRRYWLKQTSPGDPFRLAGAITRWIEAKLGSGSCFHQTVCSHRSGVGRTSSERNPYPAGSRLS